MTTKTYGKADIKRHREMAAEADLRLIESVEVKTTSGNVILDLTSGQYIRLRSAKAEYIVNPAFIVDKQLFYLHVIDGEVRKMQIFPVIGATGDGVDLTDLGVSAVAFSAETKCLVLLQDAINEVGGQVLESRPISIIRYRRIGNRKSIQLTEVEIV